MFECVSMCAPTGQGPSPRALFFIKFLRNFLDRVIIAYLKEGRLCFSGASFPPHCTQCSVSWRGVESPNFHVDGDGCLCRGSSTGCCPGG